MGHNVIITTKDEHLLKKTWCEYSIYQAQVMDKEEALKLVTLHTFKTHRFDKEYRKLSRRVVD